MTRLARVFLLLLPLIQLTVSVPLGNGSNHRRQASTGTAASPFQGNARFSSSSNDGDFPKAPPLPPLRALNTQPSGTPTPDDSDTQASEEQSKQSVESNGSSPTGLDDASDTDSDSGQPDSSPRVLAAAAQASEHANELQWIPSEDADQTNDADDASDAASSAGGAETSDDASNDSTSSVTSSAKQLDVSDSTTSTGDDVADDCGGGPAQDMSAAQANRLIAQVVSSVTAAMASATATATRTFDDGMWHPATASITTSATPQATLSFKSDSQDSSDDVSLSDGDAEGMQDVVASASAQTLDEQDGATNDGPDSVERRSIYHTHHGKGKKKTAKSSKKGGKSKKSKKTKKSKSKSKLRSKSKSKSSSTKPKALEKDKRALQIVVAGPYRKRSLVVTGSDGASINLVGGDADLLQANINPGNGAVIHLGARSQGHAHEHDKDHLHNHRHGHHHRRDLGAGLTSLVGQLGVLQPLSGAMAETGLSQLVANLVLAPLQAVASTGRFVASPTDQNAPLTDSTNESTSANGTTTAPPPAFLLSPSTKTSGVKLQLIEVDGSSGSSVDDKKAGWKQVELQATLATAPSNDPHLYCATVRKPANLRMELCDDEASKTTPDGAAPDDTAASRRFLYDPVTGEVIPASATPTGTTTATASSLSSSSTATISASSPSDTATLKAPAQGQTASMPVPPRPQASSARRELGAANLAETPGDDQATQVKLVFFVDKPTGADAGAGQPLMGGTASAGTEKAEESSAALTSDSALSAANAKYSAQDAADGEEDEPEGLQSESPLLGNAGDHAGADAPAQTQAGDSRFTTQTSEADSNDEGQLDEGVDDNDTEDSASYSAPASATASVSATGSGADNTSPSAPFSSGAAPTVALTSSTTGIPILSAQMATTLFPQPSAAPPRPTASVNGA